MVTRFSAALSRHGYLLALAAIAASTAVFLLGRGDFAKGQWALLYLLIILLVARVAGTGPGLLAAVLAFFTWNFFFLPPYHTLEIHDPKDWLSLVAFLVVGVIVGVQAGRMAFEAGLAGRSLKPVAHATSPLTAFLSEAGA